MITNERVLSDTASPYGIEFSYLSNYLYVTYDYHEPYSGDIYNIPWLKGEIVQYDVNATNIPASGIVIFDNFFATSSMFSARGALQLALDKKIYYSNSSLGYNYPTSNFLSVIHSPDTAGVGANLELDVIQLNTPTNPNHYSTQGLPPFITSFFSASIAFEGDIFNSGICVEKPVTLNVESNYEVLSVVWDFGDGFISTDLNPTHVYSSPGTYTITATITIISDTEVISREITIHPLPDAQNATFFECDFNADGIALFTLSEANDYITTQTGNTISYHLTFEEADSNVNPLPAIFANTVPNQIIYARIITPNQCSTITELTLSTNLQEIKAAEELQLCDLESNGLEIFNLTQATENIESLYSNSVNILSFHASVFGAEMDLNPLNLNHQNTSSPQIVYARVETSDCTDVVSLQLTLLPLPVISLDNVEICPDGSKLIDAGGGFQSYEWVGLQNTDANQPTDEQMVSISYPGEYSVVLTNEFGCEYEEFFNVSIKDLPYISEIEIENNGTATFITIGDGPFEYSLDGVFWQSSNTFYHLIPGDYDIYVRDADGCISLKDSFGVLEIPNFISPNNDGKNDNWTIRGISNYPDVHIQIFDRYGKLFVDRINHKNSQVWDGKYLGRTVNSGSYWYIIKLTDGRKYVGSLAVRNY